MKNAPQSVVDLPPSGFLYDPKAGRPARLKKTIALVASETEAVVGEDERHMGRPAYRRLFSTFTYARNSKGSPRDLSDCLKCLREWLRRRGRPMVPFEWVGESQERGALHYHMLIWWPRNLYLPRFDERGWWPHGSTKIERARNPVGYLVKYASKSSRTA